MKRFVKRFFKTYYAHNTADYRMDFEVPWL